MNKTLLIVAAILTILVILFSLSACDWDIAGGGSVLGTAEPGNNAHYNLTATYGAEQFNRQLTAVAGENSGNQLSSIGGAAGP